MNHQEIFDTVAKHLLTQRAVAVDTIRGCLYRDDQGRKCAIGCLIPDDIYDPNLEGESINSRNVEQLLTQIGIDPAPHTVHLLRDLQVTHDAGTQKDSPNLLNFWRKQLRLLADKYDLDPQILETL